MKAWAAYVNGPNTVGWFGNLFVSESDAVKWADREIRSGGFATSIVEVEIPDPPHEWKVGDWFVNREGDGKQCRIIDMVDDEFAYAFRDWDGCPRADWAGVWMLEEECEPCDPPEWWDGDR